MRETETYYQTVTEMLRRINDSFSKGVFDPAVDILAQTVAQGGVIHVFGTGHSEAFAMEIAGRAGGLVPTNQIAIRDLVLRGSWQPEDLTGSGPERNSTIAEELYSLAGVDARDSFIVVSNSGVNGAIVGFALHAKARGHRVVAVHSREHTFAVEPKHASGKRLCDVADIALDNEAPYGDATLDLDEGLKVGAVSSITGAFIAQLLTIGISQRLADEGLEVPIYISANVAGGDEHNHALETRYAGRLQRGA